ncbi:MAG: hypothetical protein M1814_003801 [Vezdaea aestivalis]|nr:MAG: hypothetical protein M1814_003801 [Vezdaea aestivalis]
MIISVASLLNPILPNPPPSPSSVVDVSLDTPALTYGSCTPSLSSSPRTPVTSTFCPRRPQHTSTPSTKLPKDAPLFTTTPTPTRGPIRYPPHEQFGPSPLPPDLLTQLERFSIFPLGSIATHGVRHIPYASDKKTFFDRTGREGFEVFQYTYALPPELRATSTAPHKNEYTVMWDYNIGLVRITPFFKSCGYSKTTPAKMLQQNPLLRPLSHSITGGSLAAQGYWLPYNAAKHICATFTYHIRFALVPLFGTSFLQMCIPPTHPDWSRMVCQVAIVEGAKQDLDRIRDEASPSVGDNPSDTVAAHTRIRRALTYAQPGSERSQPSSSSPTPSLPVSPPQASHRKRPHSITTRALPLSRSFALIPPLGSRSSSVPRRPYPPPPITAPPPTLVSASVSPSPPSSPESSLWESRPALKRRRVVLASRGGRAQTSPAENRTGLGLQGAGEHLEGGISGGFERQIGRPCGAGSEIEVEIERTGKGRREAERERLKEGEKERDRKTAYLLVQLARADEELVRLKEEVAGREGKKRARRASR